MPLDTSDFDAKIAEKEQAIAVIQTSLDNDAFQVQLKAVQKKASDIQKLTSERTVIENSKAQALSFQDKIDANTRDNVELTREIENLKTAAQEAGIVTP